MAVGGQQLQKGLAMWIAILTIILNGKIHTAAIPTPDCGRAITTHGAQALQLGMIIHTIDCIPTGNT